MTSERSSSRRELVRSKPKAQRENLKKKERRKIVNSRRREQGRQGRAKRKRKGAKPLPGVSPRATSTDRRHFSDRAPSARLRNRARRRKKAPQKQSRREEERAGTKAVRRCHFLFPIPPAGCPALPRGSREPARQRRHQAVCCVPYPLVYTSTLWGG